MNSVRVWLRFFPISRWVRPTVDVFHDMQQSKPLKSWIKCRREPVMCERAITNHHRKRPAQPKPPLQRGLTFWLVFPLLGAALGLFAGFNLGLIPWWLFCFASLPVYWCFMVAGHDAVHRSTHKNPQLNAFVGWVTNGFFALAFPMIRRAHLSHHAREGKPDDIERFGYRSGWHLPFGLLFGNWFYYAILPECNRRERASAYGTLACFATLFVLWPTQMFWGWWVPMQIVTLYTTVAYIYLPHGRFGDWVNEHLPFLTAYHEDHHASPSYPWHQIMQKEIRTNVRLRRKSKPNRTPLALCPVTTTSLSRVHRRQAQVH